VIRALYTAATGMQAQQLNIDVIANNLANVNTTGFKRSRADFQDLLYQTIKSPGAPTTNNTTSPTGITVGLGARPAAVSRINTQGDYSQTGNDLDMAIEGTGYFEVTMPDGTNAFTRAGAFKLDNQSRVVTSEGIPMEPAITVPDGAQNITIGQDGVVSAQLPGQTAAAQIGQVQTARFANPAGLRPLGKNLFQETDTSGTPSIGTPGQENRGTLLQGFLENSNVSVVEELVGLITSQRAYEVTSKAIQSADEMLRTTNAIVRS
jgi:flagellar basal-body rod protein FlgG